MSAEKVADWWPVLGTRAAYVSSRQSSSAATSRRSPPPRNPQRTHKTMRFSFLSSLLLVGASAVSAASSWGFDDATLTVNSKGSGVGSSLKEKYVPPD